MEGRFEFQLGTEVELNLELNWIWFKFKGFWSIFAYLLEILYAFLRDHFFKTKFVFDVTFEEQNG